MPQPLPPYNFIGVAGLSSISFTWDVEGEFIQGNDAAPDTTFEIGDFLDDLNFDGGDPAGSNLFEEADGQPLVVVDSFEVQVGPVADFSEIFVSTVQKDQTYRYSVPDQYLQATHYARIRAIKSGVRSDWLVADPILPYRFDSASKTSEGQYRISDGDISPNSLTGSSLAPTIEIGASGFTTLTTRGDTKTLELDKQGLRLRDGNTVVVELPTDSRNPSLQGDLVATSLDAYGATTLRDKITLPTGASATLSSGKYPNPTTTPTVGNVYPESSSLPDGGHWNLYLDIAGGSSANKRTAWMTGFPNNASRFEEYDLGSPGATVPSTAALLRTLSLAQGSEAHAIIRVGNYLIAHYALGGVYYLATYNRSTLALVGTPTVVSVNCYEPTLIGDPTNPIRSDTFFLVDTATSGATPTALRFRHYSVSQTTGTLSLGGTGTTSSGALALADSSLVSLCGTTTTNQSTTNTYAFVSIPDTKFEKVLKLGIPRSSSTGWITANITTYLTGDSQFKAPWGGSPWGWSYDSSTSRLWAISGSDSLIYRAATNASDISTYSVGYAYGQSTGSYFTTISPTQTITRVHYTDVAVDVLDGGTDTNRIYIYFSNKLQATLALGDIRAYEVGLAYRTLVSTYNGSGAAPSASNTFPSTGTPGAIKSESSGWQLNGDGTTVGFTPTGAIVAYGGSTAPTGWVFCDGTLKNGTSATFSALWSVIGTTYGGTGQSSFAVPNLQQRFPLGKAISGTGATLGATGGSIDHGHNFAASGSGSHSHGDTFSVSEGSTGTHLHNAGTLAGGSHSHSVSGSTGGVSAINGSFASGANAGATGHTHGNGTLAAAGNTVGISGDTGTQGSGHGHSPSISGSVSSASVSVSVSGTTDPTNPPFLVVNYIIKL